jgi:murein DD-endopeptidase MepM/ murein hydrolase activator NlpD
VIFVERTVNKIAGDVTSTLSSSLQKAGVDPLLAHSFQSIFSARLNLDKDVMAGDMFEIVYEEYYRDRKRAGAGRILAATYYSIKYDRTIKAFYYAPEKGKPGHYYDEHGKSMELDILKAPLTSYRLTSGFTGRRYHPILKRYFPHYGVDLAAPLGTPVMATADGTVEFAGWRRGFGRTIILKHKNGFKTYYGHLHRFAKGIKKGKHVSQKDIIGYVGKSGVATGPHLDYRVSLNGRFLNPLKLKSKATGKLKGEKLAKYKNEIARLNRILCGKFSGQIITEHIKYDQNTKFPNS